MTKMDELKTWMDKGKFFNWDKHVKVLEEDCSPYEHKLRFTLSTEFHTYTIIAIDKKEGKSYLGCGMDNNVPLEGENHTRGNDLYDGSFTKSTWNNILIDILSCELLTVNKGK